MQIKSQYKFLDTVRSVGGNIDMVISKLSVTADKELQYGCLCPDGGYKWFKAYELELVNSATNRLGFTLEILTK